MKITRDSVISSSLRCLLTPFLTLTARGSPTSVGLRRQILTTKVGSRTVMAVMAVDP